MKRRIEILYDIARIAFASALFMVFMAIFAVLRECSDARVPVLLPVLGIAVVFAAGRLLSNSGTRLLVYIAVEILVIAVFGVLLNLFLTSEDDPSAVRFVMSLCWVIDAAICAKTAVSAAGAEAAMHRFDACIIVLCITILAGSYLKMTDFSTAIVSCFVALILLLAVIIAFRTEKSGASGGVAGVIVPVLLIILIMAAALLIGALGSSGAGNLVMLIVKGFKAVAGAVASVFVFIWSQWSRFCAWIGSFFEAGEAKPVDIPTEAQQIDLPEPIETSQSSLVALYVLTALAAGSVLTVVILVIRNVCLKKNVLKKNNRTVQRTSNEAGVFKAFISRICDSLKYRYYCFRYRNTPAGLLSWCEKRAFGKLKKRRDESGPQFLRRLAAGLSEDDARCLRQLADLVEECFYGYKCASVDSAFTRAVRSCRFRK